jgi:O-acetylhomoserine (thiol)-lyase
MAHFSTKALHWGYSPADHMNCLSPPIYQTTSYEFQSIEDGRQLNSGEKAGHIYSRVSNPTLSILENKVARLEGGLGAVSCASGHAAQFLVLNNLMRAGDHMISSPYLYGGTYHQFHEQLPRLGINVSFVEPSRLDEIEKQIKPETKVIYAESLGNPELNPVDIEALSKIAKRHHIPLVVDNTLGCCGYLIKPISLGADIVIASLTKWAGGHGNSVGGIVIDSGKFDWSSGRFPEYTEKGADNQSLWDKWGVGGRICQELKIPFYLNLAFISAIKQSTLRDWGPCMSPFNAYQILQGIETLALRTERSCENAGLIAHALESNNLVRSVRYPGLESDKYYSEAKRLLTNGFGSVLTFELEGGFHMAERTIENVKIFKHAANIGDAKSLILHPASTTHYQLTHEEKAKTGVTESMIRLSIGIEHKEDLIEDLSQAIQKASQE